MQLLYHMAGQFHHEVVFAAHLHCQKFILGKVVCSKFSLFKVTGYPL